MGSVLRAVANAGVNFLGSKLFGGGSRVNPNSFAAPTPSINAGGFKGSGGDIRVTPERAALTGQLAGQFVGQADRLSALVGPGLANLRQVRLNQIDDAARRAIGNLRDNLQRRRVFGSSFANDALARAELEAGRQRAAAEAQTFQDAITLDQQESDLRRRAIVAQLSDLDAAANIGLELSGRASTVLQQNAALRAQIATANAQGAGQFAGQNIQPIANSVGNLVRGAF